MKNNLGLITKSGYQSRGLIQKSGYQINRILGLIPKSGYQWLPNDPHSFLIWGMIFSFAGTKSRI